MWDRIRYNWKTTMAALIPAVCVVAGWWGFDFNPERLAVIAAGVYAVILLFSKDRPQE